MAKKRNVSTEVDGQQDLIDVQPEDAKTLARLGRAYLKAVTDVSDCRAVLSRRRNALLEAVKEAGIEHDELNPFTFTANKVRITVTPMAEKISVREVGEAVEEESEAA